MKNLTKFQKDTTFSVVVLGPRHKSALYVENHPYIYNLIQLGSNINDPSGVFGPQGDLKHESLCTTSQGVHFQA